MSLTKEILEKYKSDCKIFIETGTYEGEAVQMAIELEFNKIYSIELDKDRYNRCVDRFKDISYVKIINGHSHVGLENVLKEVSERCLFWLDAHPGYGHSPIIEEIKIILNHSVKDHIILIDDMRCFGYEFDNSIQSVLDILSEKKISFESRPYATNDILIARN